jgi:methyltransferase (TIGR00027 family)
MMAFGLPNLSYLVNVAELRHIQYIYERGASRNPDSAVNSFLSLGQQLRCKVRGRLLLPRLRANPWYHYVLARTKYYDEVFLDAIYGRVGSIVNLGCGSDTRAYRFAHILCQKLVSVVECDQPELIKAKEELARRQWVTEHVQYVGVDLNSAEWSKFLEALDKVSKAPTLVMMEGVSPYIGTRAFRDLLSQIAKRSHTGSRLAFDFKIAGINESFTHKNKINDPFRLPANRSAVAAYHLELGYVLEHFELSHELCDRLAPGRRSQFSEDCLIRLRVGERAGE